MSGIPPPPQPKYYGLYALWAVAALVIVLLVGGGVALVFHGGLGYIVLGAILILIGTLLAVVALVVLALNRL